MWGSEFTTKAATLQGVSEDLYTRLNVKLLVLTDCAAVVQPFPPRTAEYNLEKPSEKSCAPAAKIIAWSWLRTQEHLNLELVSIFGLAARYRRAAVDSSHNDAHPNSSTLHKRADRPHTGFVDSLS